MSGSMVSALALWDAAGCDADRLAAGARLAVDALALGQTMTLAIDDAASPALIRWGGSDDRCGVLMPLRF